MDRKDYLNRMNKKQSAIRAKGRGTRRVQGRVQNAGYKKIVPGFRMVLYVTIGACEVYFWLFPSPRHAYLCY